MAAANAARKSRASRAAEQAAQDQGQQPGQEQPQPEAKPRPYALLDTEIAPISYYRPRVRVCVPTADGQGETVETITCQHSRYWHETPDIALRCAGRLAAQRGLPIGAPAK
jgi:hypothetical protein